MSITNVLSQLPTWMYSSRKEWVFEVKDNGNSKKYKILQEKKEQKLTVKIEINGCKQELTLLEDQAAKIKKLIEDIPPIPVLPVVLSPFDTPEAISRNEDNFEIEQEIRNRKINALIQAIEPFVQIQKSPQIQPAASAA
jgi:hypothetical protein